MNDQTVLNLIARTFSQTLSNPQYSEILQSLKTHLYNRSFAEAFPTTSASPEDDGTARMHHAMLETYVVRWVPTRVLCYTRIFQRIANFLPSKMRVISIGAGCGSETLALQAAFQTPCIICKGLI